ncbi:MAG TPA: glycosyltransferase family 39 protein [Anaeromyxobacteraceae bacterium]|nr:glycosyltransferase family 39 protein [Anaeromyxobacteraceae bacterium]
MTLAGELAGERRRIVAIVCGGFAVRMAVAALVPLTSDEAYYVDWARHLAAGYLDHPPLVAWLIAGSLRLLGPAVAAVRLPAVVLQAVTTLLAASLARALAGPGAALVAVLALQAAPVFSLGALLMTPDAPLALAWMGALWSLERAFRVRSGQWRFWIAMGLFLGLGALAKLHAGLIGLCLAASLLATSDGRRALLTPWPWVGALLALAVCSPFLLWNAKHGWATFTFQARHGLSAAPVSMGASLARILGSVAGQLAYVSPLLLVAVVAAGWRALVAGPRVGAPRFALALSALPVVAFFTGAAALSRGALPHWAAPGWLSGTVLLAAAGSSLIRPAVKLGLAMSALLLVALPLAPLLVGGPLDELRGWKEAVEAARAIDPRAHLATTHWMAVGQLGWYAQEPVEYLSDRVAGPTYYDTSSDPRPLLVVAPVGLGPGRSELERLAGPLQEKGSFVASCRGRPFRTYRFYAPLSQAHR